LDAKLREEASTEEDNERERERKWCGNKGKIGREVKL